MKKIWPALLITWLSLVVAISVSAQKTANGAKPKPSGSKVHQPGKLAPSNDNKVEERAISDVLARFYDGWNTHDADKMVSVYADDVDHVNVFAEWKKGKAFIRETMKKLHAGPVKSDHKTYSIEKIRFIKPDVAVVHVRSLSEGPGSACGGCGNLGTYVMSKESGQWLVVSFTNVSYELTKTKTDK